MDWDGLLAGLAGFVVVIVPIVGFTARFALNPLLDRIIRLREVSAATSSGERLSQLALDMQRLTEAVERLEEVSRFEREIRYSALPRKPAEG